MEVIRAGAQADIDGPAQGTAEFGGQQIALYLEFGDRVRTRQHRGLIIICRVVVDAIQQKVVVLNPVAVDADQEVLIERVVALRDVGPRSESD